MIVGFAWALLAGSLLSVQNVFNGHVSARTGTGPATAMIFLTGFLAALAAGLALDGPALLAPRALAPWHLVGGLTAVGVVVCLTQAFRRLGPAGSVSLVVASQLVCALAWDARPLAVAQVLGLAAVVAGVALIGRR